MINDGLLPDVGEGEEYPIINGRAPGGFQEVSSGYGCLRCGATVPKMASWAKQHLEWHRQSGL